MVHARSWLDATTGSSAVNALWELASDVLHSNLDLLHHVSIWCAPRLSQSVLYIFSSRLGLISDVWPHCVASNQHNNPMYNRDKQ